MTHIDSHARICGHPILEVRRLLRSTADREFAADLASYIMKIGLGSAKVLMARLEREGFIERSPLYTQHFKCFESTEKGRRLAFANAAPEITRRTAVRLLTGLVGRMNELPARPFAFTVDESFAFGSYTTDAPRLSDVDVAIKLKARHDDRHHQWALREERVEIAIEEERRFSTIIDRLYWPAAEVWRFLRNRSRYLHIQAYEPADDLPDFVKVLRLFPIDTLGGEEND